MKGFHIFPIFLLILTIPNLLSAQDNKMTKKQQEEMEMKENKATILDLVDHRKFLIAADMIQDQYLDHYQVNPTTNFVRFDSTEAVVQFGLDQVIGWNGVGGLTVEGRIHGYEIRGHSGLDPVSITTNITSPIEGLLTVYITIFNDGMARATVTGSFGSRLTFFGKFETLDGVRIYKGIARY